MTDQFPPAVEGPAGPSGDQRNLAMLVHLGTLLSWFIGGWGLNIVIPLVGYLWKRNSAPFVGEHSREELNFQLSLTIYILIAGLVTLVTIGLGLIVIVPLALVVGIIVIVVMIRASIAASRGDSYRYPFTLRLVS